ncbi:MAG TPA: hypothetical protein PKK30_09630 [Nitrospira sp.]|jgi:hypothetical protein|nr:hypothetical protein [Nitrospira sp.]HNO34562.1 hypothetical protein [Nitrospira sp.]
MKRFGELACHAGQSAKTRRHLRMDESKATPPAKLLLGRVFLPLTRA